MNTYKQLTYEQRCQIYALKKTGMSQNKIAKQLKVSQSTISREFSRKTGRVTALNKPSPLHLVAAYIYVKPLK